MSRSVSLFFPLVQRSSDVSGNGHRNSKSTYNAPWSLITERIVEKLQCLKLSSPWQPGRASVCLDRHHLHLCQHITVEDQTIDASISFCHILDTRHTFRSNKKVIWPSDHCMSQNSLPLWIFSSLWTLPWFSSSQRVASSWSVWGYQAIGWFGLLLGNAFVIGFHPSTCKPWTRTALVFLKKKKPPEKIRAEFWSKRQKLKSVCWWWAKIWNQSHKHIKRQMEEASTMLD